MFIFLEAVIQEQIKPKTKIKIKNAFEAMSGDAQKVTISAVGAVVRDHPEVGDKLQQLGIGGTVDFLMHNSKPELRAEFQNRFIESARKQGKTDIEIGNLWIELEDFIKNVNAERIAMFDKDKKATEMLGKNAVKSAIDKTKEGQGYSDKFAQESVRSSGKPT